MIERTSTQRLAEIQLNNSFWADFPNALNAIRNLPGWETASIFAEIGRDQGVIEALRKAREFLKRRTGGDTLDAYIPSLEGYFFEEHVFRLTERRLVMMGIDGVLLSPDQTIGIYRIGHPNYTVNDSHHSLRKTLTADLPGNIRIPDGIVFETSQGKSEIRALCEYSLGRLNDRKRYQRNRFRSEQAIDDILVGGFLQEQIGEYLAGLNLGLSKNLTRSGEFLFIYNDNEIAEGFIFKESDMTCRIHVPFTREAFKGVISTLVEDIQNSLRQDPETPRLRSGRASSG